MSVHEAKPGASTTEATPPVAVSVFDGPPSEMADLVPDNPNARIVQWTFKKPRTRDIYIVCGYADTRIGLSRKAPPEVVELRAVGHRAWRDLQVARFATARRVTEAGLQRPEEYPPGRGARRSA